MNYEKKHKRLFLSALLMSKLTPANLAKLKRLPPETQEMILKAAIEEGQISHRRQHEID